MLQGVAGDAAGAYFWANLPVSFKDKDFEALLGQDGGTGQSGRTRPHDDGVKFLHGF
jgi:hypothetical protein